MRAPDGKAPPKHQFPWRADIDWLVKYNGMDRHRAQTAIITIYMDKGELGPLADAINDGRPLEPYVLNRLATMISEGTLVAKRLRHRGKRGEGQGKSERYIAWANFYEEQKAKFGSAKALDRTADKFGVNSKSVERAIQFRNKVLEGAKRLRQPPK